MNLQTPEPAAGKSTTPPDARPLVLVISVSAGAGHVRAGQALCAASGSGAAPCRMLHLDALDFMPAHFRWLYADLYLRLVRHWPAGWRRLYDRMHRAAPDDLLQRLRRRLERRLAAALLRRIDQLRPSAIVCTHFMPAELLAYRQESSRHVCPVWIQITDFDVHRLWIQPGISGYCVAGDVAAQRLLEAGVAASAIHRTGLPLMPGFAAAASTHASTAAAGFASTSAPGTAARSITYPMTRTLTRADSLPTSRHACAARLGIDARAPTVLLMGGGAGSGDLYGLARQLLAGEDRLQIIVLAGRNAVLAKALGGLSAAHPKHLLVQGFTGEVESFMACADLVVTKPGGLSTAECLAMGLPMILHAPIPGQEEANAAILVAAGVARLASDAQAVCTQVRSLLGAPLARAAMARRARALARPAAAADVLARVLDGQAGAAPGMASTMASMVSMQAESPHRIRLPPPQVPFRRMKPNARVCR